MKMDLVRDWFRKVLRADRDFQDYLTADGPDATAHRAATKHIMRKLVLGNTIINSWFEEEDLRWTEDHDIIRSMVDKTLKSLNGDSIELQKLSLDWEEDKEFVKKLFHKSARLEEGHRELIAKNTRNWEVDRLPMTDRVILMMAIAELTEFPNIPVKVTINEYIELAKQYSTPKSRNFINGILDVIAKELKEGGHIQKSGRGLLDNR